MYGHLFTIVFFEKLLLVVLGIQILHNEVAILQLVSVHVFDKKV